MKILHILAHQNLNASKVNKEWAKILKDSGKVTTSYDLYAKYPDFKIDVAEEQKQLLAHDRIVIEFPVQWYSTPALVKKWIDDVIAYNFAYGPEGGKLKGKELLIITSTGSEKDAYAHDSYNKHTLEEFFYPLETTFSGLCGMKYIPPFVMHGAKDATPEKIKEYGQKWAANIDK